MCNTWMTDHLLVDKAKLYKKALDRCPESYNLWESYNDWINMQHVEGSMSLEETDKVYTVSQWHIWLKLKGRMIDQESLV